MAIANKPLIDLFWDQGPHYDFGCPVDFGHTAPKGKTQIFVLSPEISLAAEKLVRSSTFKFPELDDIYMPYEHTAIEYELTPEIRAIRGDITPGTHQVTRIGAYIHAIQSTPKRFVCTPYWELGGGRRQHSMVSFLFGTDWQGLATISLNTKPTYEGSVEAMILPCLGVIRGLDSVGVTPEQFTQQLHNPVVQQHIHEAGVEVPLLMFASSMLISCKSGMAKSRVDARTPSTLGLGARKRKALSSSAYTIVHLSALESVNDRGVVTSHVGTAAHYVRGHFKQRKHGVYWWNPFIRGTGEPRKRDAYIVKE